MPHCGVRHVYDNRTKMLLVVSRRLLVFIIISLLATAALFAATLWFQQRLMISWLVFECGIVGGFVSIQQRLKHISSTELRLLTQSWATVLVVPIYGGTFALVFYALTLAGLIEGHLFPSYHIAAFPEPPTTDDILHFLSRTYPAQGEDVAKLIFWSFAAGFSERLVPQIIHRTTDRQP